MGGKTCCSRWRQSWYKIEKGDEISIMDRDGLQMGELVFLPDGVSDAGMIGGKERAHLNIIETLATGDSSEGRF